MSLPDEELTFDPESHIYRAGALRLPSVTKVMKEAGIIDTSFYNEAGAKRGTYVHLACELYDKGTLDEETLDPALVPYLDAWKLYKSDTGLVLDLIEKPLSSMLGFAGMLDRTGRMDGRKWVIDIKSGAVSWWAGVQMAAYKIMVEEMRGNEQSIYSRTVVQLKPNGKYSEQQFLGREDRKVFMGALAVANARINSGTFWGKS